MAMRQRERAEGRGRDRDNKPQMREPKLKEMQKIEQSQKELFLKQQ